MLAMDIGNTTVRIAVFGSPSEPAVFTSLLQLPGLPGLAENLTKAAGLSASPEVWIASVVPAADAPVADAERDAGCFGHFIRPETDCILPHRLSNAAATGVDRLLAALAAGDHLARRGQGRRGYVTVQCGSAATVDWVDGDGVFRGGYILPGPRLCLAGMAAASRLPDLSCSHPDWEAKEPGDNTDDAILHGLAVALPEAVAAAAGCLRLWDTATGEDDPLPVVVTGGWGKVVAARLGGDEVHIPDLVLHGIRLLAERSGTGAP
ncbi:MAG: type III pantothenate kinase [Planctomycetes bacterium]|nr:type III pantothenate kinase [Planctomycetota bacterium]